MPVEQPEDRGILLRDILETGVAWSEKSYCITATEAKGSNPQQTLTKHRRTMVAEPIIVNGMKNGKARTVDAHMGKLENNLVPRINNPNQAKQQYDCIAEPVRIGTIESKAKNTDFDSQQYRVYSPDGKSVTLCGQGGGVGAKTGLYAVPVPEPVNETVDGKACVAMPVWAATGPRSILVVTAPGKSMPVYEVRNGRIAIKGKEYPIKLADGFYIIRKLTVTECKRLQTVPVEVLSMYDGMSCGHIALDKLGAEITAYYATEIDKYAVQTTQHNFPDTVQLGDAFQVRDNDWGVRNERFGADRHRAAESGIGGDEG